MGLSIVISGAIILTVFIYILFSIPGIFYTIFSFEDISPGVSDLEQSIFRTNISAEDLEASSGLSTVNFTINNVGEEKLWNFEKFTIIITYDASSSKLTEKLSYDGDCLGAIPAAGNWCIETIVDDLMDPGVLNSGESAELWSQVSQNLDSGATIVSITTDHGIDVTVDGVN